MKCAKCDAELVEQKVRFHYLKYDFTEAVPCCPVCGMVFISEELAEGRMKTLEQAYEDK